MPLTVAVKQSRVSQLVRHPHLQHEVRLMHILEGHPAIPRIIAYRHLKHFEYLAMELLGKSLEEVMPGNGLEERTVAKIAIQLVRSFQLSSFSKQISQLLLS